MAKRPKSGDEAKARLEAIGEGLGGLVNALNDALATAVERMEGAEGGDGKSGGKGASTGPIHVQSGIRIRVAGEEIAARPARASDDQAGRRPDEPINRTAARPEPRQRSSPKPRPKPQPKPQPVPAEANAPGPQAPRIEIDDRPGQWRALVELPGAGPEDLSLGVAGDLLTLTVTGWRPCTATVPLPPGTTREDIETHLSNGILTLRLTRTEP